MGAACARVAPRELRRLLPDRLGSTAGSAPRSHTQELSSSHRSLAWHCRPDRSRNTPGPRCGGSQRPAARPAPLGVLPAAACCSRHCIDDGFGGTVWLLTGSARQSVVLAPSPAMPAAGAPAISVSMRPSASQSYAAAVADLERVLAEGRGKLDTTTVKIIEQNLAAIDRAIAEAQRALDADSGNLYLNTHLAETMRRKLDLLRQAAALVPVS